ncbi:hypothetical protein JB92DRAFT_2844464 [Gautieria morchelliformis]|nr:hypothetical protein JB92DRAFT_2844464 [Gautieria morchelliformis]
MAESTPGGSLLVAWQLKDTRVLIVGGGLVASQRLVAVLAADALVTLVAPLPLHPSIAALLASQPDSLPRITHHARPFAGPADLDLVDPGMVLTAIDDVATSRDIAALCRARRIPINVADIPPSCDFFFGAHIRRGPLQVLVSTNGNGPRLAALIKQRIEAALPERVEDAVESVGRLRRRLRERAPGVGGELGTRRMRWITAVCEAWALEDLALLDDDAVERLLDDGWEHDVVVTPHEVLGSQKARLRRFPDYFAFPPFTTGLLTGLLAATTFFIVARRRGIGL